MVQSIFKMIQLLRNPSRTILKFKTIARCYSLWEPDYLNVNKSIYPTYPLMNVTLRGYTFPVLEKFQSHVQKIAEEMDLAVENSWALPPRELKVLLFKENTETVEKEYHIKVYERNSTISKLSSITAPIFFRMLEASCPEGVNVRISEYDPSYENKRYVPDKELLDLKAEITELRNPKK